MPQESMPENCLTPPVEGCQPPSPRNRSQQAFQSGGLSLLSLFSLTFSLKSALLRLFTIPSVTPGGLSRLSRFSRTLIETGPHLQPSRGSFRKSHFTYFAHFLQALLEASRALTQSRSFSAAPSALR